MDVVLERARDLGERVAPALAALDETAAARAALAALADAELLGFAVPAAHGGNATPLAQPERVSVRALSRLRDELAYHSAMLDVMFVMQGLGSYPLAMGGSDDLRAEVLPAVAKGASVAAFAVTEPGAGSSLSEVATRARQVAGGYELNGHKTFISNAGIADFYTVLARTSGEPGDKDGLSMFYVPAQTPGVRAERFEVMAPHPIGDVFLESATVPRSALLGGEGRGLELALGNLGTFRTSVAAAANGFARRALAESRRHLSERRQFGKPLAANQGLRFDVAEMDVRLRAAQLLVQEAAAAVDGAAESGARAHDVDPELAVARAKLFATETASWIADRAVQHHGGLGVKRGSIVEHIFRDVRALRIYEGASEIQKLIISRALFAEGS